VVETNIHHPTDDTLISDGVRVIGRLLRGAKSFVQQSVLGEHKGEPFRNRTRSAKRLAHKISKMALRRTQEAKAGYRAAYERLLEVGKATIRQAGQLRDLLGESPSARKLAETRSPAFPNCWSGLFWASPAQGARRGAP
jgi:transposase, IS5 family